MPSEKFMKHHYGASGFPKPKKEFDPYMVEHWTWEDEGSLDHCEVVRKSDYDSLLELYRKQEKKNW